MLAVCTLYCWDSNMLAHVGAGYRAEGVMGRNMSVQSGKMSCNAVMSKVVE